MGPLSFNVIINMKIKYINLTVAIISLLTFIYVYLNLEEFVPRLHKLHELGTLGLGGSSHTMNNNIIFILPAITIASIVLFIIGFVLHPKEKFDLATMSLNSVISHCWTND